jgi:adenine-specific DNA-methyltransferase
MATNNSLKENAQQKIELLMNRFEEQKPFYLQPSYNETQTRRDFIDPFFKALGWDIDNEQGYAESYREVIHEDRQKDGKTNRAPDYAFRLHGGKRLFFIEAKKPSVLIKDQIEPAFQVRRYGWSAKLPISVVTDFQEFAVYDCTKKPLITDKASIARIKYLTYSDYLTDFDFIWDTFSRERVLQGSFDRFVENDKYKKGTSTLDGEFLQSLDNWRVELAKSICKSNRQLDEDEINFVVQQTIDRIIFLRIAEDRSIEPYGNLQNCIQEGNLYQNLFHVFRQADEKYNSGLFDFKKDKISPHLEIENKVLRTVINDLYYPSPYAFNVFPVEILGTAYEQFLGKQIKVNAAHKITIEQKPAVRKAGGVYYTPQFIVDYIVGNTVGKLIIGKSPREIEKIKIVDPACGSGSFLLGAYEYILKYHKDHYTKNGTISKGSKADTLTPEGNLTTNEKKRILLNNIYGVDIDTNAVEVTKLSLLIKCMEGETEASIATQMQLFHERVLPTLDNNIKSGNSLIDTDYYDNELDFGDERKIKPFSWEKAFEDIFKNGGFDVVLGNPPYVNLVAIEEIQRYYFQKKYKTCRNKSDLYSFFIEKSIGLIKKDNSKFGFIVPHTWLATESFQLLRKFLIEKGLIEEITEMGSKVFQGVTVSTVIVICSPGNSSIIVRDKNFFERTKIPYTMLHANDFIIDLEWSETKNTLYSKIENETLPLQNIISFSRGIKTSDDTRFILSEKKNMDCSKIFRGRNIKAFQLNWEKEWVWYRPDLMKEKVGCLPHSRSFFEVPEKIITQRVNSSMQLLASYDNKKNYFLDTVNVSRYESWDKKHSLKYICGLLNSKLINYWYCNKYKMPTIGLYELHSIPIKPIDFKSRIQENTHSEIIKCVELILKLNEEIKEIKLQTKLDQITQQIAHCETKINKLVYQLYDLTDKEINTVEDNFKR